MEVDECFNEAGSCESGNSGLNGRWNHIRQFLSVSGPLAYSDFEPNEELFEMIRQKAKILVIGAGGLGCELLKDLALMGFIEIAVIDMDIIDLSNLNRQFLFRSKDIGRSKAEVAADFINSRVSGCNVTPFFNKIQDFDENFYREFNIVVCGLDSIVARRWINGMLHNLLMYEDDGTLDPSTIIPLVDGGTEGFKGNARVILPGMTACIECNLDLFPPQVVYPMCTIAQTPRLPEHCIEYVRILLWPQEKPFGENTSIDGDDPVHIEWIMKKSLERAAAYGIRGVTYRLTQGVIKHIIPAVASTNAVISAICATEVFKLAYTCYSTMDNYMVFNNSQGVYTFTFQAERRSDDDCLVCSQLPMAITLPRDATLKKFITYLMENPKTQMKSPGVTTVQGRSKTLYMPNIPSLERATKPNLSKQLTELGLEDGSELIVSDVTSPKPVICRIHYETAP